MKLRIASLTSLWLTLAAVPSWAGYENGPINGTTDAWTINFGYIVSDSYVSDGSTYNGVAIGVWEFPGDTMLTVDWSITSAENGGTVFGHGTASVTDKFISANQFGYNIDLIDVTGLNVAQVSGVTYWLNLQNAVVSNGDPVFWDENSGTGCRSNGCPSRASESAVGTIPSEAFTFAACGACFTTPEPSSILLFGSGIATLAGLVRRRLFRTFAA